MNYHKIDHVDLSNGDGIRVVLWVSGCSMKCKCCHNPQTWDKDSGIFFDESAMQEILMALKPDYINGLTITGGHPFEEYNLACVLSIIRHTKIVYPNKNIWVYTGYKFEELSDDIKEYILPYVDVVVDGRYEEDKRDVSLPFVGSSNQRIWRKINGQWRI